MATRANAHPIPMPAFAPVESPPLDEPAGSDEEPDPPEVEVGSAVLHRAISEPCQATTTVGAYMVRTLSGRVVGVPSKFTEVPTDVQDTGSPQKVSALLTLTELSANPLDVY